jgi:hypothetical protein
MLDLLCNFIMYLPANSYIIAIFIVSGLFFLLIGTVLQKQISKRQKRKRLDQHCKEGKHGESKAKEYLIRHGFKIVKEQAVQKADLIVDGKPYSFSLRADFIVSKKGRVSVVDAKSGENGVEPTHIMTRRQLLEYFTFYDVDSAYLFDSRSGSLREISFVINRKCSIRQYALVICALSILLNVIFLILVLR